MSDATGRWVISFNGEIYNYRALRLELERLGCVFRTNSDIEVLINAVAQWGEAGLRKLRGMYAFALLGIRLLERLGPAIASKAPPTKRDLAGCCKTLSPSVVTRSKIGFSTPMREWIGVRAGTKTRGLRGWAANVHRQFGSGEADLGKMNANGQTSSNKVEKAAVVRALAGAKGS